jgi:hypothetical protein
MGLCTTSIRFSRAFIGPTADIATWFKSQSVYAVANTTSSAGRDSLSQSGQCMVCAVIYTSAYGIE